MAVHMTLTDIEEYNMRSIAILGCNIYSQITEADVTLPKTVLNTVKIFAVILPSLYLTKYFVSNIELELTHM